MATRQVRARPVTRLDARPPPCSFLSRAHSPSLHPITEIWAIWLDWGTTADVELTFTGGSMSDCDVTTFAIYGADTTHTSSVGYSTASTVAYATSGTGQEINNVVIPVGAVAIGVGKSTNQVPVTWTGRSARIELQCCVSFGTRLPTEHPSLNAGLTEQNDNTNGDSWSSSAMTDVAAPSGVVVTHKPTSGATPHYDDTMVVVVFKAPTSA